MSSSEFDVFLCHNSEDKPAVIRIAEQLKDRGLQPWLDKWELQPGLPWQRTLEEQITKIGAAAVFVGDAGIGPWQNMEQEAFLRQFVKRGCPVIPVILRRCKTTPELPLFLEGMTWVDFRIPEPDPLEQFVWGITSKKPVTAKPPGKTAIKDTLGRLVGVPDLPPHFLPRENVLKACRDKLLGESEQKVVITAPSKLALRGMGGVGKTVLANALCRDEEVRRRFSDGIFWITVGQDDAGKQAKAVALQTGPSGKFSHRRSSGVHQPRAGQTSPSRASGRTSLPSSAR
jgi:hypothetical protein